MGSECAGRRRTRKEIPRSRPGRANRNYRHAAMSRREGRRLSVKNRNTHRGLKYEAYTRAHLRRIWASA